MSDLATDVTGIADYLRRLFGTDGGDAPGYLSVFTLPDQRTQWFRGDDLFGETPELIAALTETQNVYVGMALQQEPAARGRGDAEHAHAIPGVWFDLDIRGPHHAGDQLPASYEEATDFLASLPLEPSLVVNSGGGLQAYWLFHELQVFEGAEDRAIAEKLSRRVQAGIILRGKERGWILDNTSDLARILRPAGTLNWKSTPPKPVRVIYDSESRYWPVDLVALCTPQPAPPILRVLPRASDSSVDDDYRIRRYIEAVQPRAEGSRDTACRQLAVWLHNDFDLPADQALQYLREWNAQNVPPLPDAVLVDKIHRARKGVRRPAGYAKVPA